MEWLFMYCADEVKLKLFQRSFPRRFGVSSSTATPTRPHTTHLHPKTQKLKTEKLVLLFSALLNYEKRLR